MMCDFIIAADTAASASPRSSSASSLAPEAPMSPPRAVGKSKAMDMLLTARMMSADEAERAGLVSRVVPFENCSMRRWPLPRPSMP